jgi:hypothetical protein
MDAKFSCDLIRSAFYSNVFLVYLKGLVYSVFSKAFWTFSFSR